MLGNDCYCLILAGGAGTRLWPLSRRRLPKQFVDFFKNGNTLLKQSVARMSKIVPAENIIISTNIDYYNLVREQLPDLDPAQILREPAMKGTGPSFVMAAYHIRDLNPNAKVVVIQSDVCVMEDESFFETVSRGMDFVERHDVLLMVGVKPTCADTRFSYMQIDDEETEGMHKVRAFTEEPAPEFAKLFVESGEFYWNAGVMMWNAEAFIKTAEIYLPDVNRQFELIFSTHHNRDARRNELYAFYEAFPHVSIDYALMEKADNVYMTIGTFKWSDMVSWDILYDVCDHDDNGNALVADNAMLYDGSGNFVFENCKGRKLVVVDGMSDLLVVDTDDVLLICSRKNEQAFKKYLNDVRLKNGEEFT
ncbi:MAG: mannose-1-phosphate guanylyltransferase [Bacteroidaceae bacterium]|nr:mannose-1-phosphate guanylyltransferase [Bacteroidaceae bacterium]